MSFAQGTLHYNLPITNGSDKRSWFDTNGAFIAIDAAIWEAAQSAGAAVTAVEALTTQVGTLSETVQTVANAYTALSGSVNTLSEVVQGHTLNIQQLQTATANKADSVAIADAYNPNLTYSVGDVVMYDGQRYKCVTAVTTGEPFDQDKWQGEDVQTVIDEINSDLTQWHTSDNLLIQYSEKSTKSIDLTRINAKEFTVLFNGATTPARVVIKIPNIFISNTTYFYYGGGTNGTDDLYAVCKVTNGILTFTDFSKQGVSDTSSSLRVLY